MVSNGVRQQLRRLLVLLGIPLVVAGVTVAVAATPAHAALHYQGTFTLRLGPGCVQVENNGRTNETPIILAQCNGSDSQRWAIFLATDTNTYWILAYGGAYPLNKCMDRGNSPNLGHMWIYGCHGGGQQRWILTPSSTSP